MAYEAATIAASARTALIGARLEFCAETVFSNPSKAELVGSAVSAGYDVILHVVMIPLELSGPRVAARAASGGHEEPPHELAGPDAEHERLWHHLAAVVPLCHRAVVDDNSMDDGPVEIASFRYGLADVVPRWLRRTPGPMLLLARGR